MGKEIIALLGLGLDNLLLSAALGASGMKGKLRIVLVFALFEGLMPLLGFLLGSSAGPLLGDAAFIAGLLVMAGLGLYILVEDDEDEEKLAGLLERRRLGWAFLGAAVGISADEGAAGISFGLVGFPVLFTVLYLMGQALVFSFVGLALGSRIRPALREGAEKVTGLVLIGMAVWLAAERWVM